MTAPPEAFPIEVFDSLTSTNDSILQLGATDAPEGTTYIARSQTQGRGRGAHRWWSPSGVGLWMSTLLRPIAPREVWSGISLLAGAAVRRALLDLGVREVSLFWPNDLQVGARKIGGILGEVRSSGERAWIALGIGINIDLRRADGVPPELAASATSMAENGSLRTADPVEIAPFILEKFWPFYEQFNIGQSIPDLVGTHLAHVGEVVEVRLGSQPPWKGTVEGLGRTGELLVRPHRVQSSRPGNPDSQAAVVALTGGEVIYGNPE